jgi:hypothetical protein
MEMLNTSRRYSPVKQSENGEVSSEIGGGGRQRQLVTIVGENSRFSVRWRLGRVSMLGEESRKAPVLFIGGLRRFVVGGEDELKSTAVDCALVFLHSGRVDLL